MFLVFLIAIYLLVFMACYPRAQGMNITLEKLPNIRPQLFMQLGFWELSASQGVEGACAKEPEPVKSRRRTGFLACLCWLGQVGCCSQGKALSRYKRRSRVSKTAFWMSQQSCLPRHWSLPEGRTDSFVGFFPSAVEVDHSLPWSTSPALGSLFLSRILLDFSISEEVFQPALLLFCQSLYVTARSGENRAG